MDPLSSSPPQDSPLRCPFAWSLCQAGTSSPLVSSAQHAPCSVSPSTSSHYIFIQACLLNAGDPTSKNTDGSLNHRPPSRLWASLPTACSSSFASAFPSFYLPGLSQGMRAPPPPTTPVETWSEVLSQQLMLTQSYKCRLTVGDSGWCALDALHLDSRFSPLAEGAKGRPLAKLRIQELSSGLISSLHPVVTHPFSLCPALQHQDVVIWTVCSSAFSLLCHTVPPGCRANQHSWVSPPHLLSVSPSPSWAPQ